MNITTGIQKRPLKVVIYGVEGVGKTTLASKFPDPLFLDLEGGTSQLDVRRVSDIKTWKQLVDTLNEIFTDPTVCKTLVIDTADKVSELCDAETCAVNKWPNLEAPGYGKGYAVSAVKFAGFVSTLSVLIDRGVNVVLLSHAQLRKIEQPDDLGAYDAYELKLPKKMAPIIKEWSDLLLFCNFRSKTRVTGDQKTQKVKKTGAERVMYTNKEGGPWDAKNRFGLPEELRLDYEEIRSIFEEGENAQTAENL